MNLQGILKVLQRLDIGYVDEISGWVRTACPFAPFRHDKGTDNNPGFGIKIEDDDVSHYNCLACKSKGILSSLPMQLAHYRDDGTLIEFGKSILQEEILGGEIDLGEWEQEYSSGTTAYPVTKFPNEKDFFGTFKSVLGYPEAIRYLAGRGLSVNTIVSLGLRYDPKQLRVLFPIYDDRTGRYAGCSGRSILTGRQGKELEARIQRTNPKFSYPKIRDYGGLQKDRVLLGPKPIFRGLPERRPLRSSTWSGVILVEGLFAFAHTRGVRPQLDCKALLGSKLTPGKLELLLQLNRPIYWLTDNDPAGWSCLYGIYDKVTQEFDHKTGALYELYGEVAQFVMTWPEGKSDPDELTGEELDHMIETAELFVKSH